MVPPKPVAEFSDGELAPGDIGKCRQAGRHDSLWAGAQPPGVQRPAFKPWQETEMTDTKGKATFLKEMDI